MKSIITQRVALEGRNTSIMLNKLISMKRASLAKSNPSWFVKTSLNFVSLTLKTLCYFVTFEGVKCSNLTKYTFEGG